MTVASDYLQLVESIGASIDLPPVAAIHIGDYQPDPVKNSKFGAVLLADGTVGLTYTGLGDDLLALQDRGKYDGFVGESPLQMAALYAKQQGWQKVLGMAAVNAISQHVFKCSGYQLPDGGKTLSHLAPGQGDHVGMVGFFPPLVEQVRGLGLPLTVVELDERWLQRDDNFEVTLEPAKLAGCNKIICTGTVLVNQTIDDLLPCFSHADQIYIVGPTVGCLPDPLFDRGITHLGGSVVVDSDRFLHLWATQQKWRDSSRRYLLSRGTSYPGFSQLLKNAVAGPE